MNVIFFLMISLIVHSIPIPFSSRMLQPRELLKWLPFRLVWGTTAWIAICIVMIQTLPYAVLSLTFSFGILMIFSARPRPGRIESFLESVRTPFLCVGVLIVILVPMFTGIINWNAGVANAQYFDSMIVETDEPLFQNPIPDSMVRLVTQEYATYVANLRISPFGSNVVVASAHITTRNGRLVWVCTIVSTNVYAENYVKGFIVVDANDPQIEPDIITETTMPVGEGLFWDRNIRFGNYLNDMTSSYQYAYPTWDPSGGLVYVQTRTPIGFDYVERAIGPIVYAENGSVYAYDSIQDTPDWITQAYAEEWLERQVTRWGGYRRGEGFDLFAGGFLWIVRPSNDRLEIHEDTRYIVNPDTNRVEAFVTMNPVTNDRTLAGVFRANSTAVYYHDMSVLGYLSGDAAWKNVVANLPDPATGMYRGAMPLLYPVEINSTLTKWTWYAPVYWMDGDYDDEGYYYISNMNLHGLALVDASNIDRYVFVTTGGTLSGEDLVYAARSAYVELMGGSLEPEPTESFNMTATVTGKEVTVSDQETRILIRTDNSTYEFIEGARSWMDTESWYTLVFDIGVGDSFTATIRVVNGINRIIAITKN
jgi:hypothetical protein